jgi:hypothetical protein
MKLWIATAIFLAAGLLAAPGTVLAQKIDLPDVTEDGLHRVPDSKMAVVYAEPEADLSIYNRVMLLDAYVAFRKNWERDQRTTGSMIGIRPSDVEKIKKQLAEEFQTVFRQTLEDGGYEVVDEAAEDVLLVRPAIINLDAKAPDLPTSSNMRTYAESAGEMTLYIELYDSVTGDLFAKALDRRADDSTRGYYTWANSVTNKMAAERILKGWAQILLDALNEARE